MPDAQTRIIPGLIMLTRMGNIFILDDGGALTVVDTGMPGATSQILAAVRALGRQPGDVRHILVTHADIDHVGSLGTLAKATGAAVYAGELSAGFIRRRASPPHLPRIAALINGVMQRIIQPPADVTQIVGDGDVLPIAGGMRVIATPGHTPDNLSYFWERERVLFCADLLNRWNGLLPTPPAITWDRAAAHESVRRVLALDPAVVCVGHGAALHVASAPGEITALRGVVGA